MLSSIFFYVTMSINAAAYCSGAFCPSVLSNYIELLNLYIVYLCLNLPTVNSLQFLHFPVFALNNYELCFT